MAVLVYCNTAEATSVFKRFAALTPDGSLRSSDGERSKMELWDGLVDHWYEGPEGVDSAIFTGGEVVDGGTKAQAVDGSM